MSKFYGQVIGSAKTNASRRGTRNIITTAQSWDGSLITEMYYSEDGKLMVRLEHAESSSICGYTVFHGTMDELLAKLKG